MSGDMEQLVEEFLSAPPFAVVGASNNLHKFGAQVFQAYLEHGLEAYPINPGQSEVQGHKAYPCLADIPVKINGVSIITPPEVTAQVIEDAAKVGIHRLWLQPGSESPALIRRAEELGHQVISGGPCVLVALRLHTF